MKQTIIIQGFAKDLRKEIGGNVSEVIWETFDELFRMVHRQSKRVEELEARIIDLERHLNENVNGGANLKSIGNITASPTTHRSERAA